VSAGRIWLLRTMIVEKWRATTADEEATTAVDDG
jgi:hypothetical protein